METHLFDTYQQLPIAFSHGIGCWLYDNEGKKYLDALGGIAVCALGHCHPEITHAIIQQAQTLIHTSNVYRITHAEELASKLCEMSGMEKVFFSNSGAEANEAALKLSRLFARTKNIEQPQIIAMKKAFHGRTLATISASGNPKIQAGFEPLVPGFLRVPFNDSQAVKDLLSARQDIVAVMVEPIQGEGGIALAEEGYLSELRSLCDRYDCLLILDEVQCGMGRTGKFFAYQHENILPDIVTCAKALANGIPIGACLAHGKAAELFKPGSHGSTFGGNPFATRIASAVLNTIEKENLIAKAAQIGNYLKKELIANLSQLAGVKDIRGKGLMLGIELDRPCRDSMYIGLQEGILFNVTAERVIRLLPPLILNVEETDLIIQRISNTVKRFLSEKKL